MLQYQASNLAGGAHNLTISLLNTSNAYPGQYSLYLDYAVIGRYVASSNPGLASSTAAPLPDPTMSRYAIILRLVEHILNVQQRVFLD
jgi:hypothetical protein